jgi:hypothetical protein
VIAAAAFCGVLSGSGEAGAIALIAWGIAAAVVGGALRIAEQHMAPRHATILSWLAIAPFLGVTAWAIILAGRIYSGITPAGEYGPGVSIGIGLAIGAPIIAVNAGAWLLIASILGFRIFGHLRPALGADSTKQ